MNLILGLILATIISWLNFVIVDTFLGLPEAPGVKGAETVGYSIKNRKGDLAGGWNSGSQTWLGNPVQLGSAVTAEQWRCGSHWRH